MADLRDALYGLRTTDDVVHLTTEIMDYTPDSERHAFYRQHHRACKALRRGMTTMS